MRERLSSPEVGTLRPLAGRPPGPDPVRLAGLLVRAWLEVRAGRRPLAQLTPLISPAAHQRLAAQLGTPVTHRVDNGARIRRLTSCTPASGVREVTVLIDHHDRTTAISVRMERHRGAWRAVELAAPEAGLPAIPTASVDHGDRPRDAFDEVFEEAGEPLPLHLRQ